MMRFFPQRLLPTACCLLLLCLPVRAQLLDLAPGTGKTPLLKIEPQLSTNALQPGHPAALALVIDIKGGYHAQSHNPLDPNLIPFEVRLEPNPALDFGPIQYPTGKIEQYKALGKLSVYTGQTIIYVPLAPKTSAALGSLKIKGTASYQICDDKSCFPPDETRFEFDATIAVAWARAVPNRPELFRDYNPPTTQSSTGATTSSSASAPPLA